MEKCVVLVVEFRAATIAGYDTRCEKEKYFFRDWRDVETVETVEKYVMRLMRSPSVRDLMVTFNVEGEYYSSREGVSRIIREDGAGYRFRVVRWPARNVIDDSTLEKLGARDVRRLYLETVEKLQERFPDAETATA